MAVNIVRCTVLWWSRCSRDVVITFTLSTNSTSTFRNSRKHTVLTVLTLCPFETVLTVSLLTSSIVACLAMILWTIPLSMLSVSLCVSVSLSRTVGTLSVMIRVMRTFLEGRFRCLANRRVVTKAIVEIELKRVVTVFVPTCFLCRKRCVVRQVESVAMRLVMAAMIISSNSLLTGIACRVILFPRLTDSSRKTDRQVRTRPGTLRLEWTVWVTVLSVKVSIIGEVRPAMSRLADSVTGWVD